jgi:hypothetical protein
MFENENYKMGIIFFCIDISVVCFILYHLYLLRSCSCFTKQNINTSYEISVIFFTELLLLGFYILNIFQVKELYEKTSVLNKDAMKTIGTLFFIMAIFYSIIFFTLENLKTKVDIHCACYHTTFTYLIYFQLIFFTVSYSLLSHRSIVSFFRNLRYEPPIR